MADTLDILTNEEARAVVQHDDVTESDEIAVYVTAASRVLDQWAGPVVVRTVTAERHDGGRESIVLNHRPVTSITSVTEYRGSTATVLSSETLGSDVTDGYYAAPYLPDPRLLSGIVRRRDRSYDRWFECGRGNVAVTYVAGRYATTTSVDARFKRAAALVLTNMWRDREPSVQTFGEFETPAASFPTYAVPKAVRELLAAEIGNHEPWGIG